MLRIYFDASGSRKDHPTVVVGGCIATVEQWDRLEPDWNRTLKDAGVLERNGYRALHMKDLAAGRLAFEGWTPHRRADLMERLALLLRARVSYLVGSGMPMSVYDGAAAVLNIRKTVPHPWTYCASRCVEEAAGWCLRTDPRARISYVFERGDINAPEIVKLMDGIAKAPKRRAQYQLDDWSFGGKDLVGLQVADWVAYEMLKAGEREVLPHLGDSPLPPKAEHRVRRRSLSKLLTIPNSLAFVPTVEDMLALIRIRGEQLFPDGFPPHFRDPR